MVEVLIRRNLCFFQHLATQITTTQMLYYYSDATYINYYYSDAAYSDALILLVRSNSAVIFVA